MIDPTTLSSKGTRGRWVRQVIVGAALAAAGSWSSSAHASRAYAYVLSSGFGFGGGCPSCHNNQVGGIGTVTRPFGITLMDLGLKAADVSTLYEALTLLEPSNRDSDGDTISDFDELAPDGDPNDPAVSPEGATPIPTMPTPVEPQPTPTAPSGSTSAPAGSTTAPSGSTTAPSAPSAPPADTKDDGGCAMGTMKSGTSGGTALVVLGLAAWVRRRRAAR